MIDGQTCFFRDGLVRQLAVAVLLLIGLVALARSSLAQFEAPLIDRSNAPGAGDFHSVYAFNRGYQPSTGTAYNADDF